MKADNIKKVLRAAVSGIFAVSMAALMLYMIIYNDEVSAFLLDIMPRNIFLRICLMAFIYFMQGVIPFLLLNPVFIMSSMVFSMPVAVAVNIFGSLFCMVGPFFAGKYCNAKFIGNILDKNKKLKSLRNISDGNLFLLSYFLRVLGLSNTLLGLFFGSLRMNFFSYMASGFIGMLPGMLIFTLLGADVDLRSPVLWTIVAVYAIVTLFVYLKTKKLRT